MKNELTKSVLVTLANDNWVKPAKQLFASAKMYGDWQGDFLLLSDDIKSKNLAWFKKNKVIVYKVKPLLPKIGKRIGLHTNKFYLFQMFMKKWDHIVYLDADIIVQSPIDSLLNTKFFAAARDINEQSLSGQLRVNSLKSRQILNETEQEFGKTFDLSSPSFNAGVIAINSKLINKHTFKDLVALAKKIGPICQYADQSVLNIYFYKKWHKLPRVYNLQPLIYVYKHMVSLKNIKGIILHFAGGWPDEKPWHRKNLYHKLWLENLKEADEIDLNPGTIKKNMLIKLNKWNYFNILFYEIKYSLYRHHINPKMWIKYIYIRYLKNLESYE